MLETILLVDDEIANRNAIKRVLRHTGLNFLEAGNGKDALEIVDEIPVDLVLLDIGMPVMDGYKFLERFKSRDCNQEIPVCVMTAWSDNETRKRVIDLGADDFVGKPADRVELETRVKALLRIRGYQKRLLDFNNKLENLVEERTRDLRIAYVHLEESREETMLAYHDTIMRLSLAAEHKDRVTAAHIQRMSHYSELLALKCGWGEEDASLLLEAAKMHDIGKIGVPDAILNKPGKLTSGEFETMKMHCEIGASILSGSDSRLLQMAESVAKSHHERFDGTGYPYGMSGMIIPEVGRIVAIADVFDALMTSRPYKEAWPLEKVCSVMQEDSGKHFDPDFLELFFEDVQVLLKIHNRYSDEEMVSMNIEVA